MKKTGIIIAMLLVLAGIFMYGVFIRPQDSVQQAEQAFLDNRYDDAIDAYQRVINQNWLGIPLSVLPFGPAHSAAEQIHHVQYEKAAQLLLNGNYTQAISLFKSLGAYNDAAVQLQAAYYQQAESFLNSKRYDEASASFSKAGSYLDAASRKNEVYYQQGKAEQAAGNYQQAATAYEKAGTHTESVYCSALFAMDQGAFEEANELLKTIITFEDVPALIQNNLIQIELLQTRNSLLSPYMTVGAHIFFGHYEQDGNLDNGPEPIEWIVLKTEDHYTMLASASVLACMSFYSDYADRCWEDCIIRDELNNSFCLQAFSVDERKCLSPDSERIQQTSFFTTHHATEDDLVTILDYHEMESLFPSLHDAVVPFSQYALQHDAENNSSSANYWLKNTSIEKSDHAEVVMNNGTIDSLPVTEDAVGVRPVIWIDLDLLR